MEKDLASLKRIQAFMECIQEAKRGKHELSFLRTPTENGDNITVTTQIDGNRIQLGILFWDVSFLQQHGLVDVLDEDDLALGLNITDGIVEDAEQILAFVNEQLAR